MRKELDKIIELENSKKFELLFKHILIYHSRNKSDFLILEILFLFSLDNIEEMPNFLKKLKEKI
jgi:hypothetical protein